MSDHVYSRDFIERAVRGRGLIADREPRWVDIEEATKVQVKDGKVWKIGKALKEWDAVDTGFFVLDDEIFKVTEILENEKNGDYSLSEVMERAKVSVTFVDGLGWTDVDTPRRDQEGKEDARQNRSKGNGGGRVRQQTPEQEDFDEGQ